MKTNMGNIDRIIRIVIALILSALYFTKIVEGTMGIVALAVGGIMIFTSVIGFCPLYTIFGINTCPKKEEGK